MTTLSFQLHAVNQLNEVNQLLDAAETKVTFWGRRVVTAAGYSGSLYLDDIAKRTVMIVGKLYSFDWRKDNRRLQETVAILAANHSVFQKLNNCYQISDTQIKNSNFLTRIFACIRNIRDLFFPSDSYRYAIERFQLMHSPLED